MQENTSDRQKRIVQKLDFNGRTAKRVRWTEWEFTVPGPHKIRVTNASYGIEKNEHTYNVTVANHVEQDDLLVPLHCDCPADHYGDDDCKHKVAIAVCGGPVLLGAAMAYTSDRTHRDAEQPPIMTDGGQQVAHDGRERALEPERAGEREQYMHALGDDRAAQADALGLTCPEWCDGPDREELPCFRCFFTADATDQDVPGR